MDYAGVHALMQARGVDSPGEVMDKLRILERETLTIHREKRERGDAN